VVGLEFLVEVLADLLNLLIDAEDLLLEVLLR
jgi:hypothetical protein